MKALSYACRLLEVLPPAQMSEQQLAEHASRSWKFWTDLLQSPRCTSRCNKLVVLVAGVAGLLSFWLSASLALWLWLSTPLPASILSATATASVSVSLVYCVSIFTHSQSHTHSHTLPITCTCCYDQIKGTQDKDFSYSFSDSLSGFGCFSSGIRHN